MATFVPTYTGTRELPASPNQLPSVRMTAAPTADQLGANQRAPTDYIGKGLRDASDEALRVQIERQTREDADMVFRAETMARDRYRKQLADWVSRRGVQSWGVTDEAARWFDDSLSDIREGLNERQRRAFDQTVARMRETTLDRMSVHEATERRTSLDESASAAAASAIGFGVDNLDVVDPAGNRTAIDAAREEINRAINVRSSLQGWTPERTGIERRNLLTSLHLQAIERLSDRDPAAAEAYYKRYADEIDPTKKAKTEESIRSAGRLVAAQEFADDVLARGLTESEALREAREQFSGEDEKMAVAEVQSRFIEMRRAEKERQDELFNQAKEAMGPAGTSVARIPPSIWNNLTPDQRNTLTDRAHMNLQRHRIAADKETKIDPIKSFEVAQDFIDAIDDAVPDDATAADDLRQRIRQAVYAGEMSRQDGESVLRRLRDKYNPGKPTDPESIKANIYAVGSRAVANMSWSKSKKGEFAQVFQERVLEEQAAKGRQITQAEAVAIANDLLVKGSVPGRLWGTNEMTRFDAIRTGRIDEWTGPGQTPAADPETGRGVEEDDFGPRPRSALDAVRQKRPLKDASNGKTYYLFKGQWYEL